MAIGFVACLVASLGCLPSVEQLADPGMNLTIQVKDWKGYSHPFIVGP